MGEPLPSWYVQVDLIGNAGRFCDDDSRALIGNVANEAGLRFATVAEVNATAQALGLTW
jgi:hypothetical protein